jgi:hypothetical protein
VAQMRPPKEGGSRRQDSRTSWSILDELESLSKSSDTCLRFVCFCLIWFVRFNLCHEKSFSQFDFSVFVDSLSKRKEKQKRSKRYGMESCTSR